MDQYSKSVLASLFFAAAFHFTAQAEIAPIVETHSNTEQVQKSDVVLKKHALEAAVMDNNLGDFINLLSMETETQKWPEGELDEVLRMISQYQQGLMFQVLMDAKADAISVEAKNAALLMEASNGDLEHIKILHKAGADIHTWNDMALHRAAEYGRLSVVKYLMENGANALSKRDNCLCGDRTAFMAAVRQNRLGIVKYMIEEQHVPVNVRLDNGLEYSAALDETFDLGMPYMAELLLEHGAIVRDDGGAGLAIAVRKDDWVMVRLALTHGVTLKNTYRYFEANQDVYAEDLAGLKNFMKKNNIPLPSAVPANLAPSP